MKVFIIMLILLILGGILFPLFTYYREIKKEKQKVNKSNKNIKGTNFKPKVISPNTNFRYTQDLLEFENIVPCNKHVALLKVNNYEYLAYLEVQGVPFNLLSDGEKFSLEKNYGDLLNGVDHEFQIYIQSRSLNLDNYVDKYKEKIEELKKKVIKLEEKLTLVDDSEEIEKINIDIRKKSNQLEYGYKLLEDFKIKNLDSKLLERRYYIIIKYVHDSTEYADLADNEILELAYNDLVNKANLFIDTLVRNKLACSLLNGVQLAELLYNSNNKDDANSLKIENAIRSKYNHLCSTAEPLFLKEINSELNKLEEEQKQIEKNIQNQVDLNKRQVQ